MANDAAEVAPNVYKVLFENERVRLLEARVRPGDNSAMHFHPDYLVYNLGDGKVTFTSSSGQSAELVLKAGETMWREAEEHSAKNLGTTDVAALIFELKH
jgi:beta-alanine degradation protein BauB